MDPLTHTLTGAAPANTRLAHGVRLATPTLLIAVNVPDVDVLSYVAGGWVRYPWVEIEETGAGHVGLPGHLPSFKLFVSSWRIPST
ncbi:MAG: hypothetical protein GY719_33075 [bacterium]|nr:hypothetical protein [bacterium]